MVPADGESEQLSDQGATEGDGGDRNDTHQDIDDDTNVEGVQE